MLLTNWLTTLTSRIKKRPTFRSRDRRAIRRRWQTATQNQITTAEVLEDRTLLTTFFVDDNYTGASDFTGTDTDPVTGGDQNAVFGFTAFATIQEAINAAAASGDIINVAAGTYAEDVIVDKSVILQGANAGIAGHGVRGAESLIDPSSPFGIEVRADDVTIDGFEITGLNRDGINVRPTNSGPGLSTRENIVIQNNYIHETLVPGSQVNGIVFGEKVGGGPDSTDAATISFVTIADNLIDVTDDNTARGMVMTGQFASIHYDNFDITGNVIQAKNNGLFFAENPAIYTAAGIEILDNTFESPGSTGINAGNLDSTSKVNGNTFINNASGAALNFAEPGGEVLNNIFENNTNVGLFFFDDTYFPQSSENPTVTGNSFTNNGRQVGGEAPDVDLDAILNNNTLDGVVEVSSNSNLYGSIQEAIDNALPGDDVTVVINATYTENVDVNKAVTLMGEATVDGSVTASVAGATIAPGFSPGTFTSTDLNLTAGSSLSVEIDGTSGGGVVGGHDQYVATGNVNLGGATLDTTGSDIIGAVLGDTFEIIDVGGTLTGTFTGLDNGDSVLVNGQNFRIYYNGGDGNDVVLTFMPPVPVTYVDTTFTGVNGTFITDADPNEGGDQNAVIGVNAFATIQGAIDSVDAGGTVNILAGTYNENVNVDKSVTLDGVGTGSTIIDNAGTLFTVTADNVRFQDMTLQNASQGIRVDLFATSGTADHLQVDNVHFIDMSSRGIEVHNNTTVTNMSVANSLFQNTGTGIRLASSAVGDGIDITNTVFDGGSLGFYQANDGSTGNVRDLQVAGSTFRNFTDTAIFAEEIRDSAIDGNDFEDNRRDFTLFKNYTGAGTDVENLQFINNNSTDSTNSSVLIYVANSGLAGTIDINGNTINSDVGVLEANWAKIDVRLEAGFTHAPININENEITLSGTFGAATAAYGIQVRGASNNINIERNTLDGGSVGSAGGDPATSGIFVRTDDSSMGAVDAAAVINVRNNSLTGFDNAVSVYDSVAAGFGGLTAGAQLNVNNNSITGNTLGIASGAGATVNASDNWWGGIDDTTIAGLLTGPVDFSAYLNDGTDTDGGTAGFQGDYSILNVTSLGEQTGPSGRIQEAVEKITPGGTINVKSGTYAGNVDATITGVDKSVTLVPGNSPGQVVINGDLKLDSNDQLDIEVNGTVAGTEHDQLVVNGAVSLGDATLNLIPGFTPADTQSFVLLENDDTDGIVGSFNGFPEGFEFIDFFGVTGLSAYLTYSGGDGNDVAIYTEIPTPVVTIPADGNPDEYSLQIVGGNVILTDVNSGDVIWNTPLAALEDTLVINGEDGQDDTLSIDMTGIDDTTPLQIEFNGGTGGNDAIALVGGSLVSMEYFFFNASDGSIQLNGSGTDFITYTGLEPISSTVNATNVTLNYSGVDETITVTDAGAGQTTVDSTAAEVVTFNNPTGTLTINAGDGTDVIDIDSLAPNFSGNLIINGEAGGDDVVSVNSAISLNAGRSLTVNAERSTVSNGVTVTATGIALNSEVVDLDGDLIGAVSGDANVVVVFGSAGGADLQDAVDVAGNGGVINVSAGNYLVSSTLDVDESVSIVGAGSDVVQIRKAGAPSTFDIVVDISADNVSLSGAQLGWQTHTSATDYRGYVVYTNADYTTLNGLLFGDNYRSAVVFEGADYLEVSDSVFEGKFGRAAIRDGDSGSGEHFLITRNEFREDHYRWGPISIGPQGTFNDPNNQAFSGEISFNYFNNGLEAGAFQEEGDQNYTIIVTNQGMTADGLDIIHNTFVWEDAATVNQLGNYAQAGGVYFDPALPVAPGEVNITDNIFDGYTYQGPQPSTDPLWQTAGGVFGGALEFDGTDDYAFFQDPAFDVGTAGTLSFWINMHDTSRRNMFFEGLNGVGFEFQYREDSGGQFYGSPERDVSSDNYVIQDGGAANPNVWQNIQYTWDFNAAGGPKMFIYIDGTEVGYLSSTYDSDLSQWAATVNTVSELITVGKDAGGGRHFDGLMDDVGWFNSVLNQTDRDNIRNSGVATLAADPRLVAHWDFDQAAGDIAIDNKNGIEMYIVANGISPLGPVFQPGLGQFGGALEFDGIDDFATFQDPSFDVGAQGTLNFWVNMDDAGRRNQFFEGPGDAGLEFQYRTNSGGQFFGRAQDDGEYVISSGGDSAYQGVWTNIQYTWDASTGEMRIYVNGSEQSYLGGYDQNLTGFDLAHFTDTINGLMNVGRDPGDPARFFDGMMDDIAWFDTVLSSVLLDDIRLNSVGGSALNGDPSLIAYWNLDDAPGTDVVPGDGGTGIDLMIQAEPPQPPIEGFGVIAPSNANVTYNAFNDNDVDSNVVLDPTNQFGDPLFAYENDVLYTPSPSLEDKFAIGFGSTAAYGSSEFAVDTATDTPHIGAFQDSTLFGSGDIVVYGTGEDDLLDITFTDANTAVFILTTDVGGVGETTLGPVILTGITSLTFNGLDGDDIFRINNPVTGYADPVGGIFFNGGTGGEDGDGDVLQILGGTATTVEHQFANANDGSIFFDGEVTSTITYTGLEPIIDTITATDRIFSYTGAAETITLADDGDVGDGESQINSTLGEIVVFAHPTGTLTINTEVAGGSGADTVIVNAVDSTFTANLTVNAGNDDTLTIAGPTNIGSGNADLSAGQVNVNGTFTTSGTVDVDANDQITFAAAGIIDATANTIDLTAGNNIQLGQITTSGDVTVTATAGAISDANAGNNITANQATLTAGAGAGVGDALETALGFLEGNISGGLELAELNGIVIGNAGGINGLTVSGNTTITAGAGLVVNENLAVTGGALQLSNASGNFDVGFGAVISNDGSNLIQINSAGLIVMTDTGTQITSSGDGTIDLDAAVHILLTNVNTSGEVQVTAAGGQIFDNTAGESPVITANTAALRAATGIGDVGAGDFDLAINTMAADTTNGDIFIQEPSAATIGTVDSLDGITAAGNISLSIGGTLNINQKVETTGAASIIQANVQGDINVNSTVQTNGGGINLYADDNLALGATSLVDTTTAELVRLFADFNNDSSGGFTQDQGSLVNARGGDLVARAYGDVEIADLQSAGGRVVVTSIGGDVVDNTTSPSEAPLITASGVAFQAAGSVGGAGDADIDTAVSTLSASATSGDVVVSNTGALIIGDVIPLSGVLATNGSVTVSASSPLTVASNVSASGTVTLTSTDTAGPGDDLTINAGVTVESTGADVVLNSGDDFLLSLTGEVIAATTITINIDPITDGAGAIVDLLGNVNATQTTINGGDDSDIFNILPTVDSPITVNG
ncbi:LamG-like jellyroll fold domain-containing protein, partial [Gimesia sp.]|uniref:LamG-like jellyroll fold domain-containing protein n=1 Tax=Gimesia sp. TaxID=2024833 RepID=UPI0032EB129D